MELTGERLGLREACEAARVEGSSVGFVPTMGFLHEGHLSLVRRARDECELAVVSIFVNPLQFGPAEDLAAYPRDVDRDLELLDSAGADLVFVPEPDEMYPSGAPEMAIDPGPLGERLEGAARPGHFRGVCTVLAKLFSIVGPCRAYFGEKDAQQLAVVRRMTRDLDLPVEVVAGDTVREPDGLAMSSRNTYLSEEERAAAVCLHEGLTRGARLVERGERDANAVRAEIAKRVGAEPLARIEYAAVVDEETFEEVSTLDRPARALVAARVGSTRLIDNIALPIDENRGA